MSPTIKILAQVGDQPVSLLAEQQLSDDGPGTIRATADLLRQLAGHMDDILTMFELNKELDEGLS